MVLLDNGRSALLGTELQDMLRCIRCGACMNHCPVYGAVGGHAYGWVYPGPMGAVLTPTLIGVEEAADLPNASTFCGRCEEVCPMRIPLPKLMRHYRERAFDKGLTPPLPRLALALWAFFARRPRLYQWFTGIKMRAARDRRRAARALPPASASPAAGRAIATCRRRKAAPSSSSGTRREARGERRAATRSWTSSAARAAGRSTPRPAPPPKRG